MMEGQWEGALTFTPPPSSPFPLSLTSSSLPLTSSLPSMQPSPTPAPTQAKNHPAAWAPYTDGTQQPIYVMDGSSSPPRSAQFQIDASSMAQIAHSYMEDEGVWIVPKQNKIRVGCKLEGELVLLLKGNKEIFVQVGNALTRVNRFMFMVNALRMVGGRVASERAPLFSINADKQLVVPDIVYISPISSANLNSEVEAVWHKLQFTSPTVGNSDKSSPREKFHFIISLVAETNNGGQLAHYTVSSVVSPALIVIGQNPARFKRSKLKQQQSQNPSIPHSTSPLSHSASPLPQSIPNAKRLRSDSPPLIAIQPAPSPMLAPTPIYQTPTPFLLSQTPPFSASPIASPQSTPYFSATEDENIFFNQDTNFLTPPNDDIQNTHFLSSPLQDEPPNFSPGSPYLSSPSYLTPPLQDSFASSPSHTPPPTQIYDGSELSDFSDTSSSDNAKEHLLSGKVGINHQPREVLTVGGNIYYTGTFIKPSDMRIKRNFEPLQNPANPTAHRDTLSAVKLYEYERVDLASTDLKYVKERGVIAQELQKVIPSAVTVVGDTKLPDGSVVQNMLAVNDRELLIETIGATQELCDDTGRLNDDVESLKLITQEHSTILHTLSSAIADIRRNEKETGHSLCNILGIGPAWTIVIIGFFIPMVHILGAYYLCSPVKHRQVAGLVSITLATFLGVEYMLFLRTGWVWLVFFYILYGWWAMGVFVCGCIMASIFCKSRYERYKKLRNVEGQ